MKFDVGQLVKLTNITQRDIPRYSNLGSEKDTSSSYNIKEYINTSGIILERYSSSTFFIEEDVGNEWNAYLWYSQIGQAKMLVFESEIKVYK